MKPAVQMPGKIIKENVNGAIVNSNPKQKNKIVVLLTVMKHIVVNNLPGIKKLVIIYLGM